jgi:hypothetical protein
MSTHDQPAHDMRDTSSRTGTTAGAAGSTGTTAGQAESARQYVPRQASGYEETAGRARPRGLVLSFTLLAAILMILSGVMGFFEGLTAGLNGHFYVPRANYPFAWSVHGWGWTLLVIGVVLLAAGLALLMDQTWARVVGVVVASLSALAHFLLIPSYPLWSILLVAMNVFIIWALVSPRSEARW